MLLGFGRPLLRQAVQEHSQDRHGGTNGRQRRELRLKDDDGCRDQEHALERVAHSVSHRVDHTQASECNLIWIFQKKKKNTKPNEYLFF